MTSSSPRPAPGQNDRDEMSGAAAAARPGGMAALAPGAPEVIHKEARAERIRNGGLALPQLSTKPLGPVSILKGAIWAASEMRRPLWDPHAKLPGEMQTILPLIFSDGMC